MEYLVYVQASDGQPLMPTKRFGKVRRMLKDGRAVKVKSKPFTIRLQYEPKTRYVQDIVFGTDGGRTNIGEAAINSEGERLYSSKIVTKNCKIPELMSDRKKHRMQSRRGTRMVLRRKAKKNNTLMDGGEIERYLPGFKKPIKVKDIINDVSKFCHRVRPKGWLTPTATQLLRTLEKLEEDMLEMLPIKERVLEINKFAFMKLDNPDTWGSDYQNGPMKGFSNDLEAISSQQGGRCLLCNRPITQIHHKWMQSKKGSDTIKNKCGLCDECHERLHKDSEMKKQFDKEHPGEKKKYAGTSIWNQVFPYYLSFLIEKYGVEHVHLTNGWDTAAYRKEHKLEKDHDIDAYAIACSVLDRQTVIDAPSGDSYEIRQHRIHDRQLIYAQKARTYKLPIPGKVDKKGRPVGGKTVAKNRHKATGQEGPSLDEWFEEEIKRVGYKQACMNRKKLVVIKSKRSRTDPHRILPGAIYRRDGKICVLKGISDKGNKWRAYGEKEYIARGRCELIAHNPGLVYL